MYKFSSMLMVLAICACASCNSNSSSNSSNDSTMNASDSNAAPQGEGWIDLFDGKTTNGWHSYGKAAAGKAWKVDDGVLHLDTLLKKQNPAEGGDLVTNDEFENFHFKLEWKISPKGNSGIIFFINEDTSKYQNTYNSGPEMQVLDNGTATTLGHPDAKLYSHRAGDLYDLIAAKEAAKPAGEWNQAEIVADKGKLDFYLNGVHTLSTTMWDDNWKNMIAISKFKDMPGFGTYNKGRIALQDHGNDVWYRNVRIRKL